MGQQDAPGKTEEAETATGAVNSDWPGCRPTGPPHLHLRRQYGCAIEEYHRGLKQCTGVDRCQTRMSLAQRNHIGCAIRAFVRLEWHRFTTGISWIEAKFRIVREAVRNYLGQPTLTLPQTATA